MARSGFPLTRDSKATEEDVMRALRAAGVGLILIAAANQAEALNFKVREVRRSREAGIVTITYEVENASVQGESISEDSVRLNRAELELADPLGRRLDIIPVSVPRHPLERGEAVFLRAQTDESRLREAALLTLRLHPAPPFPFPVRETRVSPVEVRFEGPAAKRSPSPAALPARREAVKQGTWRLRLAGSVMAPTGETVLLLYALTGPVGTPDAPAVLEVRYSGGGALLDARALRVPPARNGEAYVEVLMPLAMARLVDGIEARLFSAAGDTVAVHPVTVLGHRQQAGGPGGGTGPAPPAPQDLRRAGHPARPF
jgi:hypothetical protein